MLEDLDTVDWVRLQHAYGCAADAPYLIRNLTSDDPEARHDAIYELCGSRRKRAVPVSA